MSKYTSFHMTLLDEQRNYRDGIPYYVVMVTSTGADMEPLRCSGTSVRSAFDEANLYIQSLLSHMCEECARQVEEYDETFRNSGVCYPCHEKMVNKRPEEWGQIDL